MGKSNTSKNNYASAIAAATSTDECQELTYMVLASLKRLINYYETRNLRVQISFNTPQSEPEKPEDIKVYFVSPRMQ
jgi:hypothetical protein